LKYRVKLGSFVGSDPHFGLAGAIPKVTFVWEMRRQVFSGERRIERDIYKLFVEIAKNPRLQRLSLRCWKHF